ncbi:MAG TPA: sigma-70 family RNA polymerase sigma factor, partial [Gemmataceae bacterium]|nr:sigma-70 family RNA polymerase sigma factor [Gemmataceae bacterium]
MASSQDYKGKRQREAKNMPRQAFGEVVRFLHTTCALQGTCDLTDCELLERFVTHREESAFTFLVRRHGPMILGVGRRLLGDAHEAEDVFQATFLVLARRTSAIGGKKSVGGWLYGVAHNIALKARAKTAARRHRERQARNQSARQPMDNLSCQELRSALDEAIGALPEKYRTPIVLCYLEGKSHNQAAKELGWPKNTVTNRLARARELLRRHLERRGIILAVGALATTLTAMATAAPMPAMLTIKTVKAAALIAAGKTVAGGCISAGALALAEEAIIGIVGIKGKLVVMMVALGLAVGGASWAGYSGLLEKVQTAQTVNVVKREEPLKLPSRKPAEAAADDETRLDRFGDPLPSRAVARIGSTRWWCGYIRQDYPFPFVFTSDGKNLVCCDGEAVRWLDASSGKEVRRIRPQGEITQFALSPDGKLLVLVTANERSVLQVWEVGTSKEIRRIPVKVTDAFAFSPDGKVLAAGCAEIRLWDVSSWQEKGRFAGDPQAWSIYFLPDSKTLISGGGNADTIRWWDVDKGREIRRLDKLVREHYRLLALSPDGKRLAAWVRPFGQSPVRPYMLYLWDATTGQEVSRTELKSGHLYFSFSPNSQILAACMEEKTQFYAAGTGREVNHWADKTSWEAITYSPNGKFLAQATKGVIRVRDARTGSAIVNRPGLPDYALAVQFTPDGKALVVSCNGGTTASWDPLSGKQLNPHQGPPPAFIGLDDWLLTPALTADGTKAALVDKNDTLHIWEVNTGKPLSQIHDPPVGQANFSPDGKVIVAKHRDLLMRMWDSASGKLLHTLSLKKGQTGTWFPHPLAFSRDSRLLATASQYYQDMTMRVWEMATGKELSRFPLNDNTSAECLAFTPDAKYLVVAHGSPEMENPTAPEARCLRLWDLKSGREVQRFDRSTDVYELAISPDGKTVAGASSRNVILWELVSGKERGRFVGHANKIAALAFSPEGRLLASGSWDYTALLWDVTGISPDGILAPRDIDPEGLKRLWSDLSGTDAANAYRAIWKMVAAQRQSIPFLA